MTNYIEILKGKIILVVEDDLISSEYLKEVFEDYPIELIFAHNGEEAINIFNERDDINLVLMDIRLPGKDGYQITKELKLINSEVPIIAQTAYALEGDKEKTLQAGCDDYLSKPLKAALLLEMIAKYI